MVDYQALYFRMFAAAADALEALEQWNIGKAKEILLHAQLEAEESYISSPS